MREGCQVGVSEAAKPSLTPCLTGTYSCPFSLGSSARGKECSQAPEQHWLPYARPCFSNFFIKNFQWWRFRDLSGNLVQCFTIHPESEYFPVSPLLQFDSISFAACHGKQMISSSW